MSFSSNSVLWERQILRLAHIVKAYNIPPALVIGFDHTGFQVLPLKNTTWAARGASVVPMIGLDDMRQITGVIVEAMGDEFEGLVVGMQLVYQGKTDRCLPDTQHREKSLFQDFIFTYTYNHWADEDTNIDLFEFIIVPHLLAVKTRLNLLDDQHAVTMLDAWPVQKTESFKSRVKAKWPWIILLYIFAGGTGKSQKYDVDGANVMKPKLSNRAAQYIEREFAKQLKEGAKAEDIRLDLTLNTLKVQQLYWLGEVYDEFKANVPARIAGWLKTKVPLAFTPEWQQRALEWKASGKLWPSNSVDAVPEGEELEPSPTQDDLVLVFTVGQELADRDDADRTHLCRDTFVSLGGTVVEARKKAKRAGITAEDLEYEIEDMTPETVCLCLAANQDEYSFRLKVGKFVSPPLHLLHVQDVDPESGKILWQWYFPKAGSMLNSKTRVLKPDAMANGFTGGKSPVKAWCSFFNDEFIYCWELDEGDFPGSIPEDFQPSVLANLGAMMKAQRQGKNKATSGTGPSTSATSA
ncbi:hypothetical protein CYMTET_56042 [Cymbomonas tetramitiformis]|uniref:Uncharacterized protein n=1 Tax=Cymbomonas tetramitiformis TaxID=36881 RepID=A0AAE0BCX4_9CHLO|nr:hypothetical protein CYMTET_56042 [Cymbomonas tetramitiformis]